MIEILMVVGAWISFTVAQVVLLIDFILFVWLSFDRGDSSALIRKDNNGNAIDFYPWKALCKMVAPKKYLSKEEFDSIKNNPVIVHYLGEKRPWHQGNCHRFRAVD